MENFNSFRTEILKLKEPKVYKITNSYGTYDAYKFIRHNNWLDLPQHLTEKEFYSIIRLIHTKIKKKFLQGYPIKFPHQMGTLELYKYKTTIKIEGGKLKTNLKIDWNKTLRLWYDDVESRLNKKLVRIQSEYIHSIKYNISKARYNNKTLVSFIPCRSLRLSLKEAIKDGLDTLEYTKYERLDNGD